MRCSAWVPPMTSNAERVSAHNASVRDTTPSKSQSGISASRFARAPSRSTAEIPTRTSGDCFARFEVRIDEIEQSLRIIEQAVAAIPEGPIAPAKVPKRWKVPAGESYFAVESGRGHFGIYIQADGSDRPQKIKLRTPSFSNLSSMPDVLAGTPIADTIAIVGSVDVVMPEIDR